MSYDCPHCKLGFLTFREAREHAQTCLQNSIGFDLYCKVQNGEMTVDQAKAEQAKRPRLRL